MVKATTQRRRFPLLVILSLFSLCTSVFTLQSEAKSSMEDGSWKCKIVVNKSVTEEEVAVSLAKYTADLSAKFIKEKGYFTVVLSGGNMIDSMRKLVGPPYADSIEWAKWHVFWVDERVVPLDNKDSNYKLANDGFFNKVPIPSGNIYPIHYNPSAEATADDYEARLRHLVHTKLLPLSKHSGFPKFDLMLLGMGPDGHVASLFPIRNQRYEKKKWVTFITDSPKPPPKRITFTFPVINSATEIAMVVTSSDLAEIPVSVALGKKGLKLTPPLPVQLVCPEGVLTWFLDKDAASMM